MHYPAGVSEFTCSIAKTEPRQDYHRPTSLSTNYTNPAEIAEPVPVNNNVLDNPQTCGRKLIVFCHDMCVFVFVCPQ